MAEKVSKAWAWLLRVQQGSVDLVDFLKQMISRILKRLGREVIKTGMGSL